MFNSGFPFLLFFKFREKDEIIKESKIMQEEVVRYKKRKNIQ